MATGPDLPPEVARALEAFVEAARTALGADLRSIVLFGSAAEGKLRATSDVNVIVVLAAFDEARAAALREPMRVAHATARLEAMFLLESELAAAAAAFGDKFADVLRRRRVLHGPDLFATLIVPRQAEIARLGQVLLNLMLRLREAFVLRGLREEQLALVLADAAGPLRSCAAALLELSGQPAPSPKEALERVGATLGLASWPELSADLSRAREQRALAPGRAGPALYRVIELAAALRARVAGLPPGAP